ncbi:DUF86 domain-containing protein [Candidatus Woesearchaeota archaeon]|nr:DUF86 domain-containing protein [Candidatus Woesearchaeota archaeon]
MDKKRILALLDLLDGYLQDLEERLPQTLSEYNKDIEKQRFCERTLQLLIEVCIDIAHLFVKELKMGLPDEEESVFEKLMEKEVISEETFEKLKEMKKFRNVLIHRYKQINNSLVFKNAIENREDFIDFKKEILSFLKKVKFK